MGNGEYAVVAVPRRAFDGQGGGATAVGAATDALWSQYYGILGEYAKRGICVVDRPSYIQSDPWGDGGYCDGCAYRVGGAVGGDGKFHVRVGSGDTTGSDCGGRDAFSGGGVDERRALCASVGDKEELRGGDAGGHCDGPGVAGAGVDRLHDVRLGGRLSVVESEESVCVSDRTLRNRQLRQEKKERKKKRQAIGRDWRSRGVSRWSGCTSSEKVEVGSVAYKGAFQSCSEQVRKRLAETRAARLIAENELRAAESERKLKGESEQREAMASLKRAEMELRVARVKQQRELLEAQDVEKLKRMHDTHVMRRTETNKVAVEKAFCSLAGSGNVPSLVGGHASTVKSGSISPNSSVSEAEVRALQKGFADLRADKESLENKMRHLKLCAERKDVIGMMATVATFEPEGCEDSVGLTIPEGGVPSIWYGEGAGGYVGKDGRFHSEPEETFGYESLSF